MKLIIDTDAGIDDAEAVMMALAHPRATVKAITTVTGNAHVGKVNRNVCSILQVMGQQVPVYAGAAQPLIQPWQPEDDPYHMHDGMGDWDERPSCEPSIEAEHAASALVRLANDHPNELTLVALGPLTNIALAARLDPAFPQKIKQFVFMGGTIRAHGNVSPVAEFNVHCDPEAAYIVLDAFPMATMVSWETTMDHAFTWEQQAALMEGSAPRRVFYRGITQKAVRRYRDLYRHHGYHLPDPLAMAITLEPDLMLGYETRHVTVELNGSVTRGQTVVNYTRHDTGTPNVHVVTKIDLAGVYALFEMMLRD